MSDSDLDGFLGDLLPAPAKDASLFETAFTHGSAGKRDDYQRLEFLGDRVLGLTIADALYRQFPDEPEGQLSTRLNRLVSRASCAEVARSLDLAPHIILGKQARDDGGRESDNILGDVMEALIGALYLDQGMEAAQQFIMQHWQGRMDSAGAPDKHPKSLLQEWAAANQRRTPEYTLVERSGPDHALHFTVEAAIPSVGSVTATGRSKQEAETAAAQAFLKQYT
ncbi:ribonuclease III [Alterisphingorhabdus coralli]|uniref:Ribonuclease 3 n=1 Tax=Alterisphingorhabdus coralli TaxID=3071408 RepID=A0AA97F457_9SPHN|nr:ribonuclease III [Parasphingorhabdus sp. SCSIO 66989]WOE73994.1 ribonuclease III [Parasphingorhabdus sp. SCSIO 66989]